MPEVTIDIGGRPFVVACQEGEESFLTAAAAMLDREAQVLKTQSGRLTAERMLLMAGLLLADKSVAVEDQLASKEAEIMRLKNQIGSLKALTEQEPKRVEVPVVPESVKENLAELAARAESVADRLEEQT